MSDLGLQTSLENFPLMYHARMLADKERLEKYRSAIDKSIAKNSRVVDLGGGTGILSKYIREKTSEPLTYIDMSAPTVQVARLLNQPAEDQTIYFKAKSFDVSLAEPVDTLVSETLGYLGLDEGIVEIFYDFCQRHPSIRKLIPLRISIFYQFLHVPELDQDFESVRDSYSHHFGGLSSELVSEFEKVYGNLIRTKFLDPAQVSERSEARLIKEFVLGKDKSSAINFNIVNSENLIANALHFFFKADLAEGISLENSYSAPKTHWTHNFCRIPSQARQALLTFQPEDRRFRLRWQ